MMLPILVIWVVSAKLPSHILEVTNITWLTPVKAEAEVDE